MALQRGPSPWKVSLWTRREASISGISAVLPACRISCDLKVALEDADIVVLCTSPHAIENSGASLAALLPASTPVTDAGSVKAGIVRSLENSLGGRFIGAHPMAGSEQSGLSAAKADLFDGAACILTPTSASTPKALDQVRAFWTETGCRLSEMSPVAHDMAVARISHLPHAVAAALVQAALRKDPAVASFAGSGYRDTTRIALGPEALWKEIFLDNREELLAAISDMQVSLETLKDFLSRGDGDAVEEYLRDARNRRMQENE